MKYRLKLLLIFTFVLLTMVACGKEADIVNNLVLENDLNTQSSQQSNDQALEPATDESSLSNPAPKGSEVIIHDLGFVIQNLERPTTEIVMAGDKFNPEIEEGEEYIFVELKVTCRKPSNETCSFSMKGISLIGSYGEKRFLALFLNGVDDLLQGGEISGGSSITGILPFVIPSDENDLVLVNESVFGEPYYLAIE